MKYDDAKNDDDMSSLGVILVEAPAPKASQIAMESASPHTLIIIVMIMLPMFVMIMMLMILTL